MLSKDFEEFIGLLNDQGVKYLVVGAYAVAFHHEPRYTGDIDFFIEISEENAGKLMNALNSFGFGDIGIHTGDFLKEDRVVQIGFPPYRIDIIMSMDNVSFEQAWERRAKGKYGKFPIWYISLDDLIKTKKSSKRKKDIEDVRLLSKKMGG